MTLVAVRCKLPDPRCKRLCTKVVWTLKAVEFFGIDPVSFTPGFSQVNCAKLRSGNRLKRFPLLLTTDHRPKPGVNKNLNVLSCAKLCTPAKYFPKATKMLAILEVIGI